MLKNKNSPECISFPEKLPFQVTCEKQVKVISKISRHGK